MVPNDNRVPAGVLRADTLFVFFVLDLATGRPEGDSGPSVVVPALAEEGGPPRIPAPLIRVRAGHRMSVGQTADFEVRLRPGQYRLIYAGPPRVPPIEQAVVVR